MQIFSSRPATILPSLFVLLLAMQMLSGCGSKSAPPSPGPDLKPPTVTLARLGHTIQAGAFAEVSNAARLAAVLTRKGVDAFYFRDPSSALYKVRFGNFATLAQAEEYAQALLQKGVITDYHLVRPEEQNAARPGPEAVAFLRDQLTQTAANFLGIPYQWGGQSAEEGFDCSGLAMAVYQLNGLSLPRTSWSQYRSGRKVAVHELKKGDLVFFATNGGKKVSHVGIYTGNRTFIHAPQSGKAIQTASLDNSYFRKRFLGGRTYLGDS
ncbi:MAG: C40 family peptidase [Thermodesulfobacteriota bacterium]